MFKLSRSPGLRISKQGILFKLLVTCICFNSFCTKWDICKKGRVSEYGQ